MNYDCYFQEVNDGMRSFYLQEKWRSWKFRIYCHHRRRSKDGICNSDQFGPPRVLHYRDWSRKLFRPFIYFKGTKNYFWLYTIYMQEIPSIQHKPKNQGRVHHQGAKGCSCLLPPNIKTGKASTSVTGWLSGLCGLSWWYCPTSIQWRPTPENCSCYYNADTCKVQVALLRWLQLRVVSSNSLLYNSPTVV